MAGQTITITVKGDKATMARLRKLEGGVLKLKPAMDKIGVYLTGFFSGEVFASRGGVIGEPWPALNDNYAAWKAKRYPGAPPLIRKGVMNRSFKAKTGQTSAEIYNKTKYFEYHQEGRGVPERVMMKVDDERERRIIDIVEAEINKKLDLA